MAAVESAIEEGTLEAFPSDDERVSGSYTGYDRYGNIDRKYW
ncbi:hypothetical protein [Haladaptatus caseinilyticus]|nr:hypothetical protein [Haladaptatus caseinilyticus]